MVIQGILSTGSAGCPVCQLNHRKACKFADSVTVLFSGKALTVVCGKS